MSDYERNTALPRSQVLALADRILTERAGLKASRSDHHGATYTGAEGTVGVEVHRHGANSTVTVRTNQLRTSKVDNVVRQFLNQLPYQPGDPAREY